MSAGSNHRSGALPGLALLLLFIAPTAEALDAIVLEVRQVEVGGVVVQDASARLDLLDEQDTRLTLKARGARLPEPAGRFTDLQLLCTRPVVAEPSFGCEAGKFTARGGPTGSLDMNVTAMLRTDTGVTSFTGKDFKVAGTTAALEGRLDAQGWQVKAATGAASVSEVRKFAAPWFSLPADITGDGKIAFNGTVADAGAGLRADVTANLSALDLTNEASTIVTDKLVAAARLVAEPQGADTRIAVNFHGSAGQMLVNPVLLDFNVNPTEFEASGLLHDDLLTVDSLRLAQKDLLELGGSATVDLAGESPSLSARLDIGKLQFPSAFTSYMQITLATSILGDATTAGSLSGQIEIENNGVTRLHVKPRDMDLHAHMGRLNIAKMNGDIHWSPAGAGDAQISSISWAEGGAYGLHGGHTEFDFVTYGLNFALAHPTKLPVFDGAIAIDSFAMANLGAADMEVSFRGAVEPISMPLLAKAFGWPEFSGTLAASIPGVRLRNNVLTFDGVVESQVFGGTIAGSNIRLKDPLGNFPELFADVHARDLDLDLVTRTFEVGSITGGLEVDIVGLHLFGWTVQSFDARLATPPNDKSRHRISAKAVSSLSNVGGGGGGVVQALQSGVLRFFDEYGYDKLGITCRLRNNVCEMAGVEPAPNGYYIVKGSGIPRIDIVGNAGRVNWNQLMSSVETANFGEADVR